MGVTTLVSIDGPHVADGVNRFWDFDFKALSLAHIQLLVTDNLGIVSVVTGGFTAVGIGASNGGTVEYPISPSAPLPSGYKVVVQRLIPLTQDTILGNQGAYFPKIHENRFDLITMQIQQVADIASNSLFVPLAEGVGQYQLPDLATRANKVLGFDVNGIPIAAFPTDAAIAAGNVPSPGSPNIGKYLKALTTTTFDWRQEAGGFGSRVTVPSAATLDLNALGENHYALVTGTTGITSFGATGNGLNPFYLLKFNDPLTVTPGASLLTPGSLPINVEVGDYLLIDGSVAGGTLWAVAAHYPAKHVGAGLGTLTNIAAAATTDLGTVASHNVNITGSAVNITSFGSSANLAAPIYRVRFNTGPVTLVNSAALILPANAGVMDFRSGDSLTALYTGGGNWRVEDVDQVQFVGLAGFVNNLFLTNNGANPSTQLDITTGQGRLISPFGYPYEFGSVNGTLNAAVNGAGGLDVGALAANTWYHIWLIATGNTSTALLSLSSTSPTMPTGWTYKYRVGAIRTNVSGFFTRIIQRGNRTRYRVIGGSTTPNLPIMASGVAGSVAVPTWVAVDTSTFVPPTATAIAGVLDMANATSTIMAAPNNQYGSSGSTTNPPPVCLSVRGATPFDFILEDTNVRWASGDATGLMACAGWTDAVNAN